MLIDNILNYEVEYELILCRPNGVNIDDIITYEQLAILDEAYNIEYTGKFPTTDELTFDIPYYSIQNYQQIVNPNWSLIKGDYKILCRKIKNNIMIEEKYFIIINPKDNSNEKEVKSITCYSLEYELNKKQVRGYKLDARKLYTVSPETEKDVDGYYIGVMNYVNTLTSWSLDATTFGNVNIDFISASGSPLYRSFDISEKTLFDFLINDVQKAFGCLFIFNTINKKIFVYKITDTHWDNKGFYIHEDNYIKTINQELENDEIITRLKCYGKDDLSITGINPSGMPYIEDFTYYKTTDYMSQGLITALNNYDTLLTTYKSNTETSIPLIASSTKWKASLNSTKANAYKALTSIVTAGSYSIPIANCTFYKSDVSSIGNSAGKINIAIKDSVSNKEDYTVEVKIASGANTDLDVILTGTDLLITLGTGATAGVVDTAKNLTMYISGAINLISEFTATVETHGKLSIAETKKSFSFNYFLIDDENITSSTTATIIYQYDEYEDLRNQYLDLTTLKTSLEDELDTLLSGYYELNISNESVLLVNGLYQIQDAIASAITAGTSLTTLKAQESAQEILVCNKQLELNYSITDSDMIKIFNKHLRENWISGSNYILDKIVRYNNISYKCILNINNSTSNPSVDTAHWQSVIVDDYTVSLANGYVVTHKNGVALPSLTCNQDLIDDILDDIDDYQISISKSDSVPPNFTTDQLIELDSFVKESTWSDTAYENEEDLYAEGLIQLAKVSTPPLKFDLDVVDFLRIVEGKVDKNKVILGDLVNIEFTKFDLDMEVRLVGYVHNPENNSLKLSFSNKDALDDVNIYMADIIKNAATTSTSVSMDKYKCDLSTDNASAINDIVNNALDASKNAVLAGKDQDVVIGRNGISLTAKDSNGVVDPKQIKMISNQIVFTNDNWATASTAITGYGVYAPALFSKAVISTSGTFEGIEIYKTINSLSKKVIDIGNPEQYSSTSAYSLGDIVTYEDDEYICTTAIASPGETWTIGHWEATVSSGITINSYDSSAIYKSRILLDSLGIRVQKFNGTSFDNKFYTDTNGDLFLSGDLTGSNGVFGGSVVIGSTEATRFHIDTSGIYFGSDTFALSPFSVTNSGAVDCTSITIRGSALNTKDVIISGTNTYLNLNTGEFRLGTELSPKFLFDTDGDLHFGAGSLVWDNLDATCKTNLKGETGAQGNPGVDANLLDWVSAWNGTKTTIGSDSVITPKLFAGSSIDGTWSGVTGIAIGTLSGFSGIKAYNAGVQTFSVDATNGDVDIIGNFSTSSGLSYVTIGSTTNDIQIKRRNLSIFDFTDTELYYEPVWNSNPCLKMQTAAFDTSQGTSSQGKLYTIQTGGVNGSSLDIRAETTPISGVGVLNMYNINLIVDGNVKGHIFNTTNYGTGTPSGGSTGDIYFQYTA